MWLLNLLTGVCGSVGIHASLQVLDLAYCSIPSKSNGKGCSAVRQGNQCGKHLRHHMVFNATSTHCIVDNIMEGSSAAKQMGNTITTPSNDVIVMHCLLLDGNGLGPLKM